MVAWCCCRCTPSVWQSVLHGYAATAIKHLPSAGSTPDGVAAVGRGVCVVVVVVVVVVVLGGGGRGHTEVVAPGIPPEILKCL